MTRDSRPSTIAIKTRDPAAYSTARLIVMAPDGPEKSIVIGVPHVRIGAGSSNDVVLDDQHASRFHCEIRKTDEGWLLRDLGSLNGTRVGDIVIKEGLLQSGATITVGETSIRFLADDGRADEIAVSPEHAFGDVVGRSVRMREVFGVLERIAATDSTVLIDGETGTGKEVIAARAAQGARRAPSGRSWSSTAPPSRPRLIESELFGHEKGAFTGADARSRRRLRGAPTAARSFSTRSASCRSSCSRSCCARSSSAASKPSADTQAAHRRRAHHRRHPPQPRAAR